MFTTNLPVEQFYDSLREDNQSVFRESVRAKHDKTSATSFSPFLSFLSLEQRDKANVTNYGRVAGAPMTPSSVLPYS